MRAAIFSTAALAFVVMTGSAYAAAPAMPTGVMVMKGMLVDAKNMTLYTYDKDTEANKSTCVAMCLMNWPVLKAAATDKDMGDWKVITRDDGSKQWSYKGKPLYYFAMDAAAGDAKGDGRGMVWHVATP